MRKGVAVSPGVAVGTAYCIHEIFVNPDTQRLEDGDVASELALFEDAREKAGDELKAMAHKVASQIGDDAARIFAR